MKDQHIKNKRTKAIYLENNRELDLLLKSILRYNTFALLLLSKSEVVLGVSDHMDIFVGCKSEDMFETINVLISSLNKEMKNLFNDEEILEIQEIKEQKWIS